MTSSHIMQRGTGNKRIVTRVDGIYVYEKDQCYIDSCSGAAVTCLGYSNSYVKDAIARQIAEFPYVHSGTFTSASSEKLASILVNQSGSIFEKVVFSSSGSEAVEVALKMALQYWHARDDIERSVFISRDLSYHGGTMTTLATGDQRERKLPFKNFLHDSKKIPICNSYRNINSLESLQDYAKRCASYLEEEILSIGPKKVAGFVVETVGGSASGAVVAEKEYFYCVEQICRKYDVLLILDEVMCGMGRTGSHFAFQQEGIRPDIVAVGKGIASGYQPLSATLCTKNIAQTIEGTGKGFTHVGTYMGHATACAAAVATQEYIAQHNLLDHVIDKGRFLMNGLKSRLSSHPLVGDIRGRGLLLGIELVSCKQTNLPLPYSDTIPGIIKTIGLQEGIVLYPCLGDEAQGTSHHLLIAPAFIVTNSEIEILVDKIKRTLDRVELEIGLIA